MPPTSLLILASSSSRRQELIRFLQLPFIVRASYAKEDTPAGMSPPDIVETLSLRKASAVAEVCRAAGESGIVIGSDTIVVLDDTVLGKPSNEQHAFEMLKALRGRSHTVYSGVACMESKSGRYRVAHRRTAVRMKQLEDEQIRRYIATGEPLDKAGSYRIQGIGATLIESIEGDYFNVVGLPISLLADMLGDFGIRVL